MEPFSGSSYLIILYNVTFIEVTRRTKMKKWWLLVIVGLMSTGIFATNQVSANDSEKSSLEQKQAVELYEKEEIDGIIEDPEMESAAPVKARSLSNSRTVKLQKLYFGITDGTAGVTPVSMPNTNFSVSYSLNSKETLLHEGKTNASGEILNLTFPNIPNEVTSLIIRFYLGNNERGFIQRYNKKTYTFHHTRTIPANSIINVSSNSARFGVAGNADTYFYNFQAARLNNYFDLAVREYQNDVKKANELLPETSKFDLKPINIFFEKGYHLNKNSFHRNGHDGSKIPDIIIGDKDLGFFNETNLKEKVMHEWTHWNMYQATGMPGGSYGTHYTYNPNPETSYKEGWALFMAEMFSRGYSISDTTVQKDPQLYGKSTNMTVKHVLYDLLDTGSNDESFSISQRFLDGNPSDKEIRQLNLGIMHTTMVESKSTTLQGHLDYMEKKYILTASDKVKIAKLLEINGLSRNGYFTLDNDGNPLPTLQTFTVGESTDGVDIDE